MGELYGIMMGYLMGKSWNITMGNPVKMFPKQSIETWITGNLGRASLAFFFVNIWIYYYPMDPSTSSGITWAMI